MRASECGSRLSWSTTGCTPPPAKTRDGVALHPAVGRERRERAAVLALGEAERELAGVAERGPVDPAGPPAADVADHQLQRAPDGDVRAVALAEGVDAAVHADPAGDRAVDDAPPARRSRWWPAGRAGRTPRCSGLHRREHDRQVLGQAAGHHRVDGDLLHRARRRGRAARRRRPRPGGGSCRAASAAPAPGSAAPPAGRRSSRGRTAPRARPRARPARPAGSRARRRSGPRARRRGRGRPTASRSRAGARAGPRRAR